jgi:hypothetical protein
MVSPIKKAAELLLHVRRPMHAGYEGGAGVLIVNRRWPVSSPPEG